MCCRICTLRCTQVILRAVYADVCSPVPGPLASSTVFEQLIRHHPPQQIPQITTSTPIDGKLLTTETVTNRSIWISCRILQTRCTLQCALHVGTQNLNKAWCYRGHATNTNVVVFVVLFCVVFVISVVGGTFELVVLVVFERAWWGEGTQQDTCVFNACVHTCACSRYRDAMTWCLDV